MERKSFVVFWAQQDLLYATFWQVLMITEKGSYKMMFFFLFKTHLFVAMRMQGGMNLSREFYYPFI